MVLSLSTSQFGLTGEYRNVWRVIFIALSLIILAGITAVCFLMVPFINNSVKLGLAEGGMGFVLAVIVPSGIFHAIIIGWGIRPMWRGTAGSPIKDAKAQ